MNKRIVFIFTILVSVSLILLTINFINNYSKDTLDFKLESLIPSTNNSNDIAEFRNRLKKEVIILLNSHTGNLSEAGKYISDELTSTNLIKIRTNQYNSDVQKKIFENRYIFNIPEQLQTMGQENISTAIDNYVLDILFNPFISITSFELQNDPFLTMRTLASKIKASKYEYEDNNLFIIKDNKKYLVINAYIIKDLNSAEQDVLYETILKIKNKLQTENIIVEFTGENFFARSAAQTSVSEMTKIGIFSTIIIIVLFIFNFESITPIIIALSMLSISLVFGFLTVIAVFGSIHIMTLTLSTTLIGICVDYYIHTFFFTSNKNKSANLLLFPLAISLLTSLISYLIMIFSGMIILKQLAIFAIVALITTFIFIFVLTNLYKPQNTIQKGNIVRKFITISENKIVFSACLFISMILITIGTVTYLICTPNDDVAQMQKKDPILQQMNNNINDTINNGHSINWYIINGETTEQSFQICEELLPFVKSEESFLPCSLIPSERQQLLNINFFKNNYEKLKESYHNQNIELDDLSVGISKAKIVKPEESPTDLSLFLHNGKIMVKIDSDEVQANNYINNHPKIQKLNGRTIWNNTFTMFRIQFNNILIVSFLLSCVFLYFYFKKQIITHYIIPMITGFSCGIVFQYWLGDGYFNLFTTLAMFLVMGLGADYCIFVNTITKHNYQSKIRALVISLLTTEASFGTLSLSSTAIIASFGTVITFGLIGTFLSSLIISIHTQRKHNIDLS